MRKSLKILFYIFIFVFILTACTQSNKINNEPQIDSVNTIIRDTSKIFSEKLIPESEVTQGNSVIIFNDSLFVDLNPDLIEISEDNFEHFKYNYKIACVLDPGGFISGSGLYFNHDCDEICETYLIGKETNRRILLPSDYDAGILDVLVSSACDQLVVCSSYDGPDYVDYYGHRAELFVFNVTLGNGLNGITPAFKYYAYDWSIAEIIWISDKAIALKTYEEGRHGDDSHLHYKYYKVNLTPNPSSGDISESD
ncbi:MAG: hypothetical protein J7604_23225 [Sporocytophaga sp.]|uniref:hypothetical protein n=1 Tax=Sporocytophaga sp. TaxID=2231183 RepID=UPI001B166B8A|nr:hypothetical protein [Sporocytophaga sp.]MBO9703145.1 hypothetical protein [Sporocytophaga sp.]